MEAKIFGNMDLWDLIQHDDVLAGYIDGAFARLKPAPYGVEDGVYLTDGVESDDSGALHIWVEAGSTTGHITVGTLTVDAVAPSDVDTVEFTAGPSSTGENLAPVLRLRKALWAWAGERALDNYPTTGELAALVRDNLSGDGDESWWVETRRLPSGEPYLEVGRAGRTLPTRYMIDDGMPDPSCMARMWLWWFTPGDDWTSDGGYGSAAATAEAIARNARTETTTAA